MKEAIGGVSIFQIVIVLILIFTAIMCLTINHSKAFGVKDEIINIIENGSANRTHTLSSGTIEEIRDYLIKSGYRITGSCPDSSLLDSPWIGYNVYLNKATNNNANFCFRPVDVEDAYYKDLNKKCNNSNNCTITSGSYPAMVYYEIALFYQLDVPIIGNAMNLRMYGSTKVLFS